jgi:hypothetical protein
MTQRDVRRMNRFGPWLAASLAVAVAPACGDDTADDGHAGHGGNHNPMRKRAEDVEPLVANMEVEGERHKLRLQLLDFDPAPAHKGYNTWHIRLLDADGEPYAPARPPEVEPFMPQHLHGTNVVPVVEPGDEPGEFVVSDLHLYMGGLWEVRFTVDSEDRLVLETWIYD